MTEFPVVGPLIIVNFATYGITGSGKFDKLKQLERQLHSIIHLEHKMKMGISLSLDELVTIKSKKRPLL